MIIPIDGTWKYQIATNGMRFLDRDKIKQYYSSVIKGCEKVFVYAMIDNIVFKYLKKYGRFDDNLQCMEESPKTLFLEKVILPAGNELDVYDFPIVAFANYNICEAQGDL